MLLYSPLAGGLLTGKYRQGDQGRLSARGDAIEGTGQRSAVLDAVLAMAEELGTTASALSLAWLRHRAAVASTALITIVGPRSLEHLDAYIQSLEIELDDHQYQHLDELSAVSLGTPHRDVAAALSHGFDGNRALLRSPSIPVR